MVKNFFDLFRAGEEVRQKFVGSTVVDAGDIKQSLGGISTIGISARPDSLICFITALERG